VLIVDHLLGYYLAEKLRLQDYSKSFNVAFPFRFRQWRLVNIISEHVTAGQSYNIESSHTAQTASFLTCLSKPQWNVETSNNNAKRIGTKLMGTKYKTAPTQRTSDAPTKSNFGPATIVRKLSKSCVAILRQRKVWRWFGLRQTLDAGCWMCDEIGWDEGAIILWYVGCDEMKQASG
jgi:hypothetical protein